MAYACLVIVQCIARLATFITLFSSLSFFSPRSFANQNVRTNGEQLNLADLYRLHTIDPYQCGGCTNIILVSLGIDPEYDSK
jgi:hypothetical protein